MLALFDSNQSCSADTYGTPCDDSECITGCKYCDPGQCNRYTVVCSGWP